MSDLITGADLIAIERQRQLDIEGYTPEHDDEHIGGVLGMAASAYTWAAQLADAMDASSRSTVRVLPVTLPKFGSDYLGLTKAEAFTGLQCCRREARRLAEERALQRKADALDTIIQIMDEDEDWSSDTIQEIADTLIRRGLATDKAGMFKAVK